MEQWNNGADGWQKMRRRACCGNRDEGWGMYTLQHGKFTHFKVSGRLARVPSAKSSRRFREDQLFNRPCCTRQIIV